MCMYIDIVSILQAEYMYTHDTDISPLFKKHELATLAKPVWEKNNKHVNCTFGTEGNCENDSIG